MAIYYGIVRDRQVVVEGEVPLADSTQVEIRPRRPEENEWTQAEAAAKERLRAAGVLTPAPASQSADDLDEEFDPVSVTGSPLSEQIIDERR